jgi:hypothetical protein
MISAGALRSPCYDCAKAGGETYPDCAELCVPINDYLRAIGDRPYPMIKNSNLHLLYPKESKTRFVPAGELSTVEECAQALDDMRQAKKMRGFKHREIADLTGVSATVINSMFASHQKRISKPNLARIQAWLRSL